MNQYESMAPGEAMDIDVHIYRPSAQGPVLADASVTLGGCFAIRGVKIREGRNGPFVSMPSRQVRGEYKDICFPCTKEFKQAFDSAVLDAYQQAMEMGYQQQGQPGQEYGGPAMTM